MQLARSLKTEARIFLLKENKLFITKQENKLTVKIHETCNYVRLVENSRPKKQDRLSNIGPY